ncbi:FAD binding domain-containing protein [Nocardioides sambongensis]|uniref:FAD binding domain-containing protein n=1 Tax=Nocardioides sambongensis TaxID=2589074 RepID=UPI00112AFB28|nr:FAD binding domain-containing protein [Nocardioides sambongensis]
MEEPLVTLNGVARPLTGAAPPLTALDWLRGTGLTGAKEGCAEGECGACSVLLARPAADGEGGGEETGTTEWTATNACLLPAAALAGQEVRTAEGLGTPTDLHPVQRELAERGGSQCGYCTPGFVCSMAAEYYRPGRAGFDPHALSGNLCRCTGYRPILEAAEALTAPAAEDPLARRCGAPPPAPTTGRARGFLRPDDLAEALAALAEPGARAVAGATDLGVESNLGGARSDLLVAIDRLAELRTLDVGDAEVEIGAGLTLTEVERRLAGRLPLLDEVFAQFASRLIRNAATIGGNIGTASPIGDLPPALLALDAVLVLASADAGTVVEREVPLVDYFTGYRETVRRPGELVVRIRLPRVPAGAGTVTAFHKIAKRRFDDISSVAVAWSLEVADGVVTRAAIGLGGVAATPLRARATEEALLGRAWEPDALAPVAAVLAAEGTPMDDHRASAAYRSAMLGQSLLRLQHATRAAGPGAGPRGQGAA